MKQLLFNHEPVIRTFMEELVQTPGAFSEGRGVGLIDCDDDIMEAKLLAGAWFEKYNGVNMNIHIAAMPGAAWLNREFLWYCFHYAFEICNCKRLTGYVEASNFAARRFDEHLGFELEFVQKDAAPGGDMLVYVMWREKCRWLKLLGPRFNTQKRVH